MKPYMTIKEFCRESGLSENAVRTILKSKAGEDYCRQIDETKKTSDTYIFTEKFMRDWEAKII